jgi:hypothetical protein
MDAMSLHLAIEGGTLRVGDRGEMHLNNVGLRAMFRLPEACWRAEVEAVGYLGRNGPDPGGLLSEAGFIFEDARVLWRGVEAKTSNLFGLLEELAVLGACSIASSNALPVHLKGFVTPVEWEQVTFDDCEKHGIWSLPRVFNATCPPKTRSARAIAADLAILHLYTPEIKAFMRGDEG